MYLFVFIFVILSVLGLYTELFTLRVASLASQQKVAAETMMFWHGAAYTFARDFKTSLVGVPAAGCTLALGFSVCGLPVYNKGAINGKIYLPDDYNSSDSELVFRSVIFKVGTTDYVLTYVNSDEYKLGYSSNQIYKQMGTAELPAISYGRVMTGTCVGNTVSGHWLASPNYVNGKQTCYVVPPALLINDGAVGIISNIGS